MKRWATRAALLVLFAGLADCRRSRFPGLAGCPLETVPPGSRGWTSIVSITGPDRIKMSATGANVFGRAKVRGFWRWDGEGSALWNEAPTDRMHTPRMLVVYNQSFEDRTAMACSDRMLEVEGDYRIIPMVGEAIVVPDRVRIVPQ